MSRSQAAYLRAVKAALARMGKPECFNETRILELYDSWVKASQAAAILSA